MPPQPSDPAPTSFYVSGGTLPPDAPSYVPRLADALLLDALARGEFCYLLDTRQIGKSSLMVRAAARLRAQNTRVALLDLTRIGQPANAEQWYYGLLLDLGAQLGLRDALRAFWQGNKEIGPLQRWIEALRQVALPVDPDTPLVVFVDEIDNVLNLPFSTDEFFAGIRECYTRRADDPRMGRLTFCLLGSALPDTLIRDVRTTPFNVGTRIEPTDFTPEEAAPLAAGLGQNGRDGVRLLRRILYWTGGHPYLTQRLCAAVAADPSVTRPGGVDRLCESLFFSQSAREGESNLTFVGSRLLRSTPDLAGLLDTYGHVRARGLGRGRGVKDDPTNALHHVLRLSGVVRVVEGYLWVRNRIYFRVFDREWVRLHVPDAEARRQRAAFRRGALRAVAAAGVLIALLAGLAGTALHQKGLADVNAAKARIQSRLALASATLAQRQTLAAQQARLQATDLAAQRQAALSDALHQKQLADANALRAHTAEAQAVQQAALAHRSADQAHAATTRATQSAQEAKAQTALADKNAREAKATAERANHLLYDADMNLAQKEYDADNVKRVIELLEAHRPKPGEEDLRGFEWGYWWHLCHLEQNIRKDLSGRSIAYSSDGRLVAMGHNNGTITIRDLSAGRIVCSLDALPDDVARTHPLSVGPRFDRSGGKVDDIGRVGVRVNDISVVFSPDCKSLATSLCFRTLDENGKILNFGIFSKISNAATGLQKQAFSDRHTLKVGYAVTPQCSPVQFSPDGKQLATISSDASESDNKGDTLHLWSVDTGRQLSELSLGEQITGTVFSPDGQLLATSDSFEFKIWSLKTGRTIQHLEGGGAGQFFADSRRLLCLSRNGERIQIWDALTGTLSEELKNPSVFPNSTSLSLSPDDKRVAVVRGQKILLWDLPSREAYVFKDTEYGDEVAFSADSQRVLTSNDYGVKSWKVSALDTYFLGRNDLMHYQHPPVFPMHGGLYGEEDLTSSDINGSPFMLSPDGQQWLAVGRDRSKAPNSTLPGVISVNSTSDHKVLASCPTGSSSFRLPGLVQKDGEIVDSIFSPDRKRYAAYDSATGVTSVWETTTWHLICQISIPASKIDVANTLCVAFTPDGGRIAIWENRVGKVFIYTINTKSGKEISIGQVIGASGELFTMPQGIIFDRQGKHLLFTYGLGFYDIATGKRVGKGREDMAGLSVTTGYPYFALSADGATLYFSSGNIYARDVLTSVTTQFSHGLDDLAGMIKLSPDRKRLLTLSAQSLRLWDVSTARETWRLDGVYVASAAFTSNGKQLVIVSGHRLRVLDAAY